MDKVSHKIHEETSVAEGLVEADKDSVGTLEDIRAMASDLGSG